jgi:aminopeptidase N
MAHPIRPDSYIKMDNFYTVTVYEKVRGTRGL